MSYSISGNDATVIIEGDLSVEENYFVYEKDISFVISEHVHNIIIDLNKLDSIDTIGISILLKLYKDINALKGSVSYTNACDNVKQVLEDFKISALLS